MEETSRRAEFKEAVISQQPADCTLGVRVDPYLTPLFQGNLGGGAVFGAFPLLNLQPQQRSSVGSLLFIVFFLDWLASSHEVHPVVL